MRNPHSGSAIETATLRDALRAADRDAEILDMPPGPADEWIDRVVAHHDVIVAAGGDGTVSTVGAGVALRIVVTHHPFDVPPGVHERRLLGRSAMAMTRLAAANVDLFLSGHLHISHVSCAVERYDMAGHSALIVQAGTVSTRSRGEQPSFNVLRLHRPDIELSRCSWDDATGGFATSIAGRYHHTERGWAADL